MNSRTLRIGAVAGFIACALGLLIDPRALLASYLAAWFAVAAISIGALGVLFTSYLVRGGWTQDLQGPLSRAALVAPLVGLLLVPILIGASAVYPWAGDTADLPPFKSIYLTPLFFALRSVCYFAIWTVLALWARGAYGDRARMERVAALGLIVWSLTVSVAGIDWLESIEPKFHSSIYGLLALSFTLLAGIGFGLAAVLGPARPRRMANTSYAGVLLSVLLLWAYLHAMQYIIIWSGNIPDEVTWYAVRSEGVWAIALLLLFLGQFFVPFFALLSERVRASTRALLWIAAATLALRFLESAVLILPPLHLGAAALILCFPSAVIAIGSAVLLAWREGDALLRRVLGSAALGEYKNADEAAEQHDADDRRARESA
jgi:hypothetical protein